MPETIPLRELTLSHVLSQHAARRPDKVFLTELASGRQWTFSQLDTWTNQIAHALHSLGVDAGTHVGLLLENSAEHIAVFLGLGKLAAVSVPVNTAARGDLLAYYLEHADVELVVVDEDLVARLAPVLPLLKRVRRVVTVGRFGQPCRDGGEQLGQASADLASCVANASAAPVKQGPKFSSLVMLAYTSGTTGPSKASMVSHACALSYGTGGVEAHGYNADDVFYVCLPLFHVNALLTSTITALVCGACVVLAQRFSASRFFDEIRACKATTTNLLGAMSSFLWARQPQADDADNALRLVSVSPMPSFTQAFERRFGLRAVSNYGLSDFGTVTSLRADAPESKRGSMGVPRSYFELRVVDDDDLECPVGEVGEIVLRSKQPWRAATGYYKMAQATADANRNQWFHTGDRARRDEDGYLWFVDRKKDCIRRRGENISSFEVEQIVARHPAVGAVAVFPVSTPQQDEEVGAAVVLRDGHALGERELVEYCAARMSYFMVPRYLRFVSELPTTVNQKVEKFRLRESMEAALDEVWDRERAGILLAR